MQECYTFNIKNTHPIIPKYALLLGSTINLNGELDDPYVKIDVPESSHIQLKRELLSVKKKVVELSISASLVFIPDLPDFKIICCQAMASGTTDSKIENIGNISSGEYKKMKINIELNAFRYFLILLAPNIDISIIMRLESEI